MDFESFFAWHTRGVQKVMQLDHKEEWKCYKLHFIFQYNPDWVQWILMHFKVTQFFSQTVNSTKIEIFYLSLQPLLDSSLSASSPGERTDVHKVLQIGTIV